MRILNAIKYLFTFSLVITTVKMNAQENKPDERLLNVREQNVVAISALTATGNLNSLQKQIEIGLDSGLSINEIKEMLVQLYAYCGFPRSLNALNTFKTVLDERKARGTSDSIGKEIVVENIVSDKYEQGRKVLEVLTGVPQTKPAPGFGEFAPRIDAFLKEHLFADIFFSDVLSYRQRELATISALSAMQGVDSQLGAHIAMGINTGLTIDQLKQACELIGDFVGKDQSSNAMAVLGAVSSRIKK